jgi:hypothetical protein
MPTIQDAKTRRDDALQSWRHELHLMERMQTHSPAWEKQRKLVEAARHRYDRASMQYLDLLTGALPPKRGAA